MPGTLYRLLLFPTPYFQFPIPIFVRRRASTPTAPVPSKSSVPGSGVACTVRVPEFVWGRGPKGMTVAWVPGDAKVPRRK